MERALARASTNWCAAAARRATWLTSPADRSVSSRRSVLARSSSTGAESSPLTKGHTASNRLRERSGPLAESRLEVERLVSVLATGELEGLPVVGVLANDRDPHATNISSLAIHAQPWATCRFRISRLLRGRSPGACRLAPRRLPVQAPTRSDSSPAVKGLAIRRAAGWDASPPRPPSSQRLDGNHVVPIVSLKPGPIRWAVAEERPDRLRVGERARSERACIEAVRISSIHG